jgi:hypothetical protein
MYGDEFTIVRQYWNRVQHEVELVDLLDVVPPLHQAWST